MPRTQFVSSILIIFLIGHINICFSESSNKNVDSSQDEKSLAEDSSGDILVSSSSKITSVASPSRSIKVNITERDNYERPSSEEDEEENDPPYRDSSENEIHTNEIHEMEMDAENEIDTDELTAMEMDAENEIDPENETMEKSETFNDPDVTALASTLTKRWQNAFHRTRKAIFGAPRYIIVRYHKTFGKFLGIGKHKKEKKKKHKKKKHHHHHSHHSHESEEE